MKRFETVSLLGRVYQVVDKGELNGLWTCFLIIEKGTPDESTQHHPSYFETEAEARTAIEEALVEIKKELTKMGALAFKDGSGNYSIQKRNEEE